jgi:hypothetical protein
MSINPNYPRPKHARYLNASQFRVHEPVGMLTPVRSMKIIPRVTSAPQVRPKPLTGHKRKGM